LFGRVSSRLGPTNPRWTTFSGELKPEVITSAIEQANAGLPFQFCDMLRRAVENDAHLAGCVLQAFAAIDGNRCIAEVDSTPKTGIRCSEKNHNRPKYVIYTNRYTPDRFTNIAFFLI
jgi:hypothetical protein